MTRPDVLVPALQVAVPLLLHELRAMTETDRTARLAQWRETAVDQVAHHGDAVQFKTRGTAEAFNGLAKGIAVLSRQPGGVAVFGMLWCARHCPGGSTNPGGTACPQCSTEGDP